MLRFSGFFKKIIGFAILPALLFACTASQPAPKEDSIEAQADKHGAYPVERIKHSNACYDIMIEYPFFGRPQLDQQIAIWVDNQNYNSMEQLLALCAESPENRHLQPYEHRVDYELFTARHTVSVLFSSWTYAGGAHGISNLQPINLSVENGDEVRYQDMFANLDGLYTFLSDYVYSALYPRLGDIWQGSPMFTEGLEPIEASFKNFVITPEGLTIYFPPYQIAPYSEGTLSCKVPLTELLQFRPMPGIWQ